MKRGFKVIERSITNRTKSKSFSRYLNEVSKIPLFETTEDELKCAFKVKNGDNDALHELVHKNLRFVISVGKKYESKDAPLEDLVNQGNIGLCEAAVKFNPETGYKFISYAVWYIRKEMLLYLKDSSRQIRLPQNKFSELSKFNIEVSRLTQKLERIPDVSEILGEIPKYSDDKVETISKISNMTMTSLDKPLVDERGASTLGDMLESELNPTDSVFMNEKNPELINLLLSSLTDKQKLIITAMFGLGGSQQRTLNDVADELNLSREAVRITQKKVLRKLRNKCNRLGITHNMF
jgi:RNA polymerase primary sigma factor